MLNVHGKQLSTQKKSVQRMFAKSKKLVKSDYQKFIN